MNEQQTVARIAEDLGKLGVDPGDVVLVHSSLRSLGEPRVQAETVVQGFLRALGPEGTLLFPALSYKQQPKDIHSTLASPSNVGALPEYFRQRPGTVRSVHPTHSISGVGPAVAQLFRDHELDTTPCGPHSPLHRLLGMDAKIVMLGCGLLCNTTMHALEEFTEPPYLFGGDCSYAITDATGRTYRKTYRTHGFAGWVQRYDRIAELGVDGLIVSGQVLAAETQVIHTRLLKEPVIAKMRENPLFFVAERDD